jgi:hypothetical protein
MDVELVLLLVERELSSVGGNEEGARTPRMMIIHHHPYLCRAITSPQTALRRRRNNLYKNKNGKV